MTQNENYYAVNSTTTGSTTVLPFSSFTTFAHIIAYVAFRYVFSFSDFCYIFSCFVLASQVHDMFNSNITLQFIICILAMTCLCYAFRLFLVCLLMKSYLLVVEIAPNI